LPNQFLLDSTRKAIQRKRQPHSIRPKRKTKSESRKKAGRKQLPRRKHKLKRPLLKRIVSPKRKRPKLMQLPSNVRKQQLRKPRQRGSHGSSARRKGAPKKQRNRVHHLETVKARYP